MCSLLTCRNRNLLLWACVAPLNSIPWHAWLEVDLMQTASGGSKTSCKYLLLRVWGFGCVCMNFSIWNEQFPWIPEFAESDVINCIWVAPFLFDFVSDTTAGFVDWPHWSPKWWSEHLNEETLSRELHSGGFRLGFEWYYLQTCLFFFPYSNWLFCSEGMAPWKYYTSSLPWLVWQKSEKIKFIKKAAVISFQSKERTEERRLMLLLPACFLNWESQYVPSGLKSLKQTSIYWVLFSK